MIAYENEKAAFRLKVKGYDIQGGGLYFEDGDRRYFVAETGYHEPAEVADRLEAAHWPTRFGEIPCVECDSFQDILGGLCVSCVRAGAAVDA